MDIIWFVVLYILYMIEFLVMENFDYCEMVVWESLDEEMLVIFLEFDLFDVEMGGNVIV